MSTTFLPSTPKAKQAPSPATPSMPQTGTWRHPKLDEIVRRRDASNFSDRSLKKVMYNVAGLVALWSTGKILWTALPSVFQSGNTVHQYSNYIYYLCQVLFLFNILVACLPLFRSADEINDIPLTPAQRKLLGLPPSSAPPTPGSSYITPPRYARTPTPMSSSPGNKDYYSESPLSRKGSPIGGVTGLPFSPGPSPMLQKAIGGGANGSRRNSYGSPSPLGPSASRGNQLEAPSTPTPGASKGSKISLNNKWLYDKGRRNSSNSNLFS